MILSVFGQLEDDERSGLLKLGVRIEHRRIRRGYEVDRAREVWLRSAQADEVSCQVLELEQLRLVHVEHFVHLLSMESSMSSWLEPGSTLHRPEDVLVDDAGDGKGRTGEPPRPAKCRRAQSLSFQFALPRSAYRFTSGVLYFAKQMPRNCPGFWSNTPITWHEFF